MLGFGTIGRAFRRAAVPIGNLIEASGRIAEGEYSTRVPEWGPREVRHLARAFNVMDGVYPADEVHLTPILEETRVLSRLIDDLRTLMANALRHTPAGGEIRVTSVVNAERITVSVSDTGRGIAPGDLPHIFDRYYKSADSGGMGLGLAIAKKLVEAHGGESAAESQPGQGTTVRFTL